MLKLLEIQVILSATQKEAAPDRRNAEEAMLATLLHRGGEGEENELAMHGQPCAGGQVKLLGESARTRLGQDRLRHGCQLLLTECH